MNTLYTCFDFKEITLYFDHVLLKTIDELSQSIQFSLTVVLPFFWHQNIFKGGKTGNPHYGNTKVFFVFAKAVK